jgi:hypothetical protein
VNAVLEQDSSKLNKVAVIRLCGPYSRGSPSFLDFPRKLRNLVEGHFGYVDGGYQGALFPHNPQNAWRFGVLVKTSIPTISYV